MVKTLDFKPKMFSAIRNYNKKTFLADLMAGIIVGIVALPLAIAFGIASGVSPEKGIITAIVAGLMISLFGGSGSAPSSSSILSISCFSCSALRDFLAIMCIFKILLLTWDRCSQIPAFGGKVTNLSEKFQAFSPLFSVVSKFFNFC